MPAAFCATGPFNSAFALGAGSNATTDGDFLFVPGSFDTAIAVGTNDVVTAGAFVSTCRTRLPVGSPGSFDTAFVLGTGSTALAGATNAAAGNHDLAAVFGNVLGAATGANRLVDIVTPLGTL